MESYKRVVLSLILLLSTPLAIFGMDIGDGEIITLPAVVNQELLTNNNNLPDNPPNTPASVEDLSALDEGDEIFYSARSSIQYTGLENFDKRSVDDLTTEQAYQALLKQIAAASVQTNTPAASPRVSTPEFVMGAGAVGVLASAVTAAAPAVRSIRIDEAKTLGVSATEAIFSILGQCGYQLAVATALGVLIFETRKTVHVEEENKRLSRQLGNLHETIKKLTHVNQKHELIEHGMVVTEQKLLKIVHDHLCNDAQIIAKGSNPTQAVATLNAFLKNNKKITKKVVLAMADLEKIHVDSAALLKDEKHYSILNPLGWFEALKNMCHKHSKDDADSADNADNADNDTDKKIL